MKIYEFLNHVEKFPNPVLTIGNYDGIHIGHKKIIERVKEEARLINGTPMLMTFYPHPVSVVRPDKILCLITPLNVRKRLIEENGIDVLLVLPFNEEFRLLTPQEFVENILVNKLGIKGLIVGYDFKFGRGGKGDTELLKQLSGTYGFFFEVVEAITLDGEKIGSNRIRKLIMEGDVKKAERFLGRPHMIEGKVAHGDGRGKGIGFPTINLKTDYELIPKDGVYISEVEINGKMLPSVTNIGYNPTFDVKKLSVETHILDYSGDLYGADLTLYFHERIRGEIKFDGVEALKSQIDMDIKIAKEYFHKK
ncbi:MAG: bifunctional riboflavin kinase/FAD synthetase [Proteobacteria bacterium]|nr:bifunctional riboflavin kinase/FAD synthetase [Pseudomonadota bacterium]